MSAEAVPTPRYAPVQGHGVSARYAALTGTSYREAGTITWDEHVEVWEAYHRRWPNHQTAETIALRGGFGYNEIVMLLGHEPTTWRTRL